MEVPSRNLGTRQTYHKSGNKSDMNKWTWGGRGGGELLFPPETLIAFPFVVCLIAHECLFSCKMRRDVSRLKIFVLDLVSCDYRDWSWLILKEEILIFRISFFRWINILSQKSIKFYNRRQKWPLFLFLELSTIIYFDNFIRAMASFLLLLVLLIYHCDESTLNELTECSLYKNPSNIFDSKLPIKHIGTCNKIQQTQNSSKLNN